MPHSTENKSKDNLWDRIAETCGRPRHVCKDIAYKICYGIVKKEDVPWFPYEDFMGELRIIQREASQYLKQKGYEGDSIFHRNKKGHTVLYNRKKG